MSIIKCNTCKTKFERVPSRIKEKNYCCVKCYDKSKQTKTTRCGLCNKSISVIPSRGHRNKNNYCSVECAHAAKKQPRIRCMCSNCKKIFWRKESRITFPIKNVFCSSKCNKQYRKNNTTEKIYNCASCGQKIKVPLHKVKKSKNHFCSRSCTAKFYGFLQKIHRSRSKLEHYLEAQIKESFPHLKLIANDRVCLSGKEIDLYLPEIKLAIEINGPHHYKAIYGKDRMVSTLQNDTFKRLMCMVKGIDLICIPYLETLTNKNKVEYLGKIFELIEKRL